jgi:hypothetical protein
VPPSLVPKGTRRIKTDNRDAIRFAHYLRSTRVASANRITLDVAAPINSQS